MVSENIAFICIVLSFVIFLYACRQPTLSIPNATPALPIVGNAPFFRTDAIQFLKSQRLLHGDNFLVDLGVMRLAFFLGIEGTNAVTRGAEASGISLYNATSLFLGKTFENGIITVILQFDAYISFEQKWRNDNSSSNYA